MIPKNKIHLSILLCLYLIISGCNLQTTVQEITQKITAPFQKEIEIQRPLVKGKLPESSHIRNQWKEKHRQFVINKINEAPVYPAPDTSQKIIRKLTRTERVTVLYLKRYHGQTWAFIVSPFDNKLYGWTLKSNLLFKNQFKKMRQWYESDFIFSKGNYRAKFQVFSNGSFINRWKSSGTGLHLGGTEKGHFYESSGIIYAKTSLSHPYIHIFELTDQGLKHEDRYKHLRVLSID